MDNITCEFKTGGGELPLHFHKEYEIIYIKMGEIRLYINGNEFFAQKGDVILLSNTDSHSLEVLSEAYERYVITVPPEKAEVFGNAAYVIMHRSGRVCKGSRGLEELLERMMSEVKTADSFSETIVNSCVYSLLASVCRENNWLSERSAKEGRVYKIQKYLDENFRNEIKISELCERFFISHYYLTHTFTETIGCSPKQYIMHLRLNNAGRVLSHCSVSEAAFDSGFTDVNNFIRCFKESFGMTPGEYKKKRGM